MAVDAAHFALANLELDGRPRVRVRDHLRDVCAFVANVIELQDDRIGLPAVDTWMATEVGPQSQPIFKGGPVTSDSRACDLFLAIGQCTKDACIQPYMADRKRCVRQFAANECRNGRLILRVRSGRMFLSR